MRQSNKNPPSTPQTVGIVDSRRALALASRLGSSSVDLLEWRADALANTACPANRRFPWILTVRHPAEGGNGSLRFSQRRRLFLESLDTARFVDIELRSFIPMRDVIASARDRHVRIIASYHNFKRTPPALALRDTIARANDSGADIVKIATRTETPADISRMLDLFAASSTPLSLMGMGPLGMASRLLFASCGSVLNYGWIDRPNVEGQWSAIELKTMIARTSSGR